MVPPVSKLGPRDARHARADLAPSRPAGGRRHQRRQRLLRGPRCNRFDWPAHLHAWRGQGERRQHVAEHVWCDCLGAPTIVAFRRRSARRARSRIASSNIGERGSSMKAQVGMTVQPAMRRRHAGERSRRPGDDGYRAGEPAQAVNMCAQSAPARPAAFGPTTWRSAHARRLPRRSPLRGLDRPPVECLARRPE